MENNKIIISRRILKTKLKKGIEDCCDYGVSKEFTNEVLNLSIKPLLEYLKNLGISIK